MDFEQLYPEQVEQTMKFCEIVAIDDMDLAANLLQMNYWDLEKAVNEYRRLNSQSNSMKNKQRNQKPKMQISSNYEIEELIDYGKTWQNAIDLEDEQYNYENQIQNIPQQPAKQKVIDLEHESILAQQNQDYEEMKRKIAEDKEIQQQMEQYEKLREVEFVEGQKEFINREVADPFLIKFRLAHKTAQFQFSKNDKVDTVFRYVSSCLRDGFEYRYSQFDLIQNFPALSLAQSRDKTLSEVFSDSLGEVLIVKEF